MCGLKVHKSSTSYTFLVTAKPVHPLDQIEFYISVKVLALNEIWYINMSEGHGSQGDWNIF